LLLLLLLACAAGCGDDNVGSDGSAVAADMALCNPAARAPAPPTPTEHLFRRDFVT
jgi:hypothetical protein